MSEFLCNFARSLRAEAVNSKSGDASGKPTPSYKEILRSKDKAVSEAQQSIERSGREHLINGGKRKSLKEELNERCSN